MTGVARPAAGPYVPWPHLLAAGLLAGVALAAALPPGARVGAGAGLVAGPLLWLLLRRPPWPTTLAPGRLLAFAPPLLLVAGLGALRLAHVGARPNPLTDRYGVTAAWTGISDGETLHASAPVRAKLALVAPSGGWPGGAAPIGLLSVVGTPERAAGKRNPGGFDYAAHLKRRGVHGQVFVQSFQLQPRTPLRQRLQRGVAAGLTPAAGALQAAMTLGLRDDLGDLRDSFAAAGMAHLLALSGLHVGVLLLVAERLLRPLSRLRAPLLAALTVGFVALVGASPSVVRAATMALAALASRSFGAGRIQPWTALTLAVSVGLLHAPQMLFDLSFQLSYLAVAGMLLFLPPWLDRLGLGGGGSDAPGALGQPAAVAAPELALLTACRGGGLGVAAWRALRRGVMRALLGGMAVSSAAQLPSLSLVLHSFGVLPLLSPLINVVAVPLAGLLVPLGFLAGLAGLLAQPLARLVNLLTQPLASLLVLLAQQGARLPLLEWPEVGWLGHACWAALVTALAAWAWRPGRLKQTAAVALVAGGVAWAVPAAAPPPDVWYLDVGQGDAALIRLGGGQGVLVDGGGSPFSDFDVGGRIVLPALRALGVTRLAAVIATHPDADHIEGLLPVLQQVPVGLLVVGPEDATVALDVQLRQLAARRGVPLHEARRGQRLLLPGGVSLDLLHPAAQSGGLAANERSVAFVLRYRGAAMALFLGDLGVDTEPQLPVPPVQVLMVGHHGSRGSTGAGLVAAATPQVAVVSVGRNQYGHPAPEVMERLAASGAQLFVTRTDGAVRLDLTGRAPVAGYVSPVNGSPHGGASDP